MPDGTYITLVEARDAVKFVEEVYYVDGSFDPDLLSEDIEGTEGLVNSYISARYPVPVTGTEARATVKALIKPLLRIKAYSRLATSETPIAVLSENKWANKQLTDISKGTMALGDTVETTNTRTAALFYAESGDVEYSRDKLKGY